MYLAIMWCLIKKRNLKFNNSKVFLNYKNKLNVYDFFNHSRRYYNGTKVFSTRSIQNNIEVSKATGKSYITIVVPRFYLHIFLNLTSYAELMANL
jgi:hypothetical protein